MYSKFFLFLAFFWIVIDNTTAQSKPPMVDVKPDAPVWMKMMLENDPDLTKIKEAY